MRSYRLITRLTVGSLLFLVLSCTQNKAESFKVFYRAPSSVPAPQNNPITKEKIALGKKLFYEKRLSQDGTMACATCHDPDSNWSGRTPTAVGAKGKALHRKSPTLWNVAWGWSFFWDGRAKTLEEQALGPIQSKDEMGLDLPTLEKRLNADTNYKKEFKQVFGTERIYAEHVAQAIATFERTIIAPPAPFDRWVSGEDDALTPNQKKGFVLFNSKAQCVRCHTGSNFTNGSFADVGLNSSDPGKDAQHLFKTPTLRNVAASRFFMHDGRFETLAQVVENYNRGGEVHRTTSKLFITPLNLSKSEKEAIVDFLSSLTSEKVRGNLWVTNKK